MAKVDEVFEFLKNNYKDNEPILLSEIKVPGIKDVSVRQQLKKLTQDGRIKRFDSGVYFIPRKSMFTFGSEISVEEVLRKKYLMDGNDRCGYVGGLTFANQIGLTTQLPSVYEIYTNKTAMDYREVMVANIRVIIRKPYVKVDGKNYAILQFLNLMKEIVEVSELEGAALTDRLVDYLKQKQIRFDALKPFLPYYPDRIYKNMYEVGLLHGISA